MKYKHTKENLQNAVDSSLSIAQVCVKLGIVAAGGNYSTLRRKLKEQEISITHFTGQVWNQGNRFRAFGKKHKLEDVLKEDSAMVNSYSLKQRLYKEGIFTNTCSECGLTEWRGKRLACEIDHINGNNRDNRLENLRILCPNCHSQTDTFRSKNRKIAV